MIIGNGFAGTTCAEQLRKNDPAWSIVLFADEPYPLYNRIALPPLLRKQVTEQKVIMRDVAWHEKHTIDLRLCDARRAIDVDEQDRHRGRQGVSVRRVAGRDRRPAEPGDRARRGRRAQRLQLPVHGRHQGDLARRSRRPRSAVAVGGSFIAYELAEAFVSRGVETHWLIRGPRFLRRMLDEIAGELLDEAARADGVHMHFNEEVREFVRSNGA